MITSPCYDGRLDIWYVNSLIETIRYGKEFYPDVEIAPVWVSFDALIQRARNDIIHIAKVTDVDDVIFVDSDIEWDPEWIFKLLDYPVDVVGGTYPKKADEEIYVVRQVTKRPLDPETGLMEVDGLGTGFVRLSKNAVNFLWDSAESYIDPKDNQERRMVFDVVLENGQMVSEDIHMFNTLTRGGFKVWLDPKMTCNHIGPKKYKGNFEKWYGNVVRKQL